jgi:hypothetical protein
MKNRNQRWQMTHLPQFMTRIEPATAFRILQKITMTLPLVVKNLMSKQRKTEMMNQLNTNRERRGLLGRLQSLIAPTGAGKGVGQGSQRLLQPILSLLLISAMALSSLSAMASPEKQESKEKVYPKTALPAGKVDSKQVSAAAQYSSFKGKLNPQVVLSADKVGYLLNKFAVKGEKGKGQGKEAMGPAAPPSARYRVSVVGFVCEHETRDDIFAWDGLSDEIRLNVETQVVDRDREVLLQGQAQSRVMGSVNGDEWRRSRVQAGTADRFGGIRTGDAVPSSPAYAPRFDPRSGIPTNPELPFLLFEGELVQGMNAVNMIPTLWEIDGGAGLWPRFQSALAGALPEIITATAVLAGGPSTGAAIAPAAEATISEIDRLMTGIRGGDGGDRLIGIRGDSFSPTVIRLNYDIAELALRTRLGGSAPAGIIPIVYRDTGDLNGNYTMYVKIERLSPVLAPG